MLMFEAKDSSFDGTAANEGSSHMQLPTAEEQKEAEGEEM